MTDHPTWIPDGLGLLGVGCLLAAYLLLQTGRWRQEEVRYSVLNAAGAGGILFSLVFDFNLSAAIVEGFWLMISLWGVARAASRR